MLLDKLQQKYRLDFADLEKKLSAPENTLLVLCNPNNPTGLVLKENDLREVDRLSRRYRVPMFCDEIFAEITLTGKTIVPYGKAAGEDSLSITCTSLGKCMSLTGVNHANVIIPSGELREKYIRRKYADHYGSIDPMFYAGLMKAYTEEGKAWVDDLLEVIRENRRTFTEDLEEIIPGAKVVPAEGTFLAWVDYTDIGLDQEQLKALFERALFFGDPGSDYGVNDLFYRYSIAVPPSMLEKSMKVLMEEMRRFASHFPEFSSSGVTGQRVFDSLTYRNRAGKIALRSSHITKLFRSLQYAGLKPLRIPSVMLDLHTQPRVIRVEKVQKLLLSGRDLLRLSVQEEPVLRTDQQNDLIA